MANDSLTTTKNPRRFTIHVPTTELGQVRDATLPPGIVAMLRSSAADSAFSPVDGDLLIADALSACINFDAADRRLLKPAIFIRSLARTISPNSTVEPYLTLLPEDQMKMILGAQKAGAVPDPSALYEAVSARLITPGPVSPYEMAMSDLRGASCDLAPEVTLLASLGSLSEAVLKEWSEVVALAPASIIDEKAKPPKFPSAGAIGGGSSLTEFRWVSHAASIGLMFLNVVRDLPKIRRTNFLAARVSAKNMETNKDVVIRAEARNQRRSRHLLLARRYLTQGVVFDWLRRRPLYVAALELRKLVKMEPAVIAIEHVIKDMDDMVNHWGLNLTKHLGNVDVGLLSDLGACGAIIDDAASLRSFRDGSRVFEEMMAATDGIAAECISATGMQPTASLDLPDPAAGFISLARLVAFLRVELPERNLVGVPDLARQFDPEPGGMPQNIRAIIGMPMVSDGIHCTGDMRAAILGLQPVLPSRFQTWRTILRPSKLLNDRGNGLAAEVPAEHYALAAMPRRTGLMESFLEVAVPLRAHWGEPGTAEAQTVLTDMPDVIGSPTYPGSVLPPKVRLTEADYENEYLYGARVTHPSVPAPLRAPCDAKLNGHDVALQWNGDIHVQLPFKASPDVSLHNLSGSIVPEALRKIATYDVRVAVRTLNQGAGLDQQALLTGLIDCDRLMNPQVKDAQGSIDVAKLELQQPGGYYTFTDAKALRRIVTRSTAGFESMVIVGGILQRAQVPEMIMSRGADMPNAEVYEPLKSWAEWMCGLHVIQDIEPLHSDEMATRRELASVARAEARNVRIV